jgi:hypothetical protein
MRIGVAPLLEAEANRLLRESMAGITKFSEKSDILTPTKERERRRREQFSPQGFADASYRKGVYGRVMNPSAPHLNSSEGLSRPRTRGLSTLESFIQENAVD